MGKISNSLSARNTAQLALTRFQLFSKRRNMPCLLLWISKCHHNSTGGWLQPDRRPSLAGQIHVRAPACFDRSRAVMPSSRGRQTLPRRLRRATLQQLASRSRVSPARQRDRGVSGPRQRVADRLFDRAELQPGGDGPRVAARIEGRTPFPAPTPESHSTAATLCCEQELFADPRQVRLRIAHRHTRFQHARVVRA